MTTEPQPPEREPYEPPELEVLGSLAEMTRSNQAGDQPDLFALNSPSPPT